MARRNAQALITARKAKRTKKFVFKAAAAKRTQVGQSLKRAEIPFGVSSTGITVTVLKKPSTIPKKSTKTKVASRNQKIRRRSGVHMRRASLFRVSAAGELRTRARRIEAETLVISPRGRPLAKGVTDPFAKPPSDQPQGVQDFFLSSRAIRRYAYDPSVQTLEVVFTTGYGYHFFKVPRSVWINFQMAPSKGRFFMNQIYGHWTGRKGSMTYHPNYKYERIQ